MSSRKLNPGRISHETSEPTLKVEKKQIENVLVDYPIETTDLFENLLTIFSKKHESRTDKDLQMICKALKKIKVFGDLKKDDFDFDNFLIESFNLMEHESFDKGSVIFHWGDRGDKFYIILTGSVEVYIPKSAEEIAQDIQENKKHSHPTYVRQNSDHFECNNQNYKNNEKMRESVNKKEEASNELKIFKSYNEPMTRTRTFSSSLDKQKNFVQRVFSHFTDKQNMYFQEGVFKFKRVRIMGPGTHFGEVAITSNMARGATIIASSDLHVMTLTKEGYKQICKNIENSLKNKWKFFSELLSNTAQETITKFCYTFREKNFKYNHKIIEEGTLPQEVFVIYQGEVQVVKYEKGGSDLSDIKYLRKQRKIFQKKIVNLGASAFFGEGEALTPKKPYEYSVISITNNTFVYSTTIKEFNMLRMDHPDVFQNIFSKYNIKMGHWSSRSAAVASHRTEKSVEILPTQESSVQITWPSHPKNYYQAVHSPRLIEEKLKSIPNAAEDKHQLGLEKHISNKKLMPLNQTIEMTASITPRDQKLKLPTSEPENKVSKKYLTKKGSSFGHSVHLQKLVFDRKDLIPRRFAQKEKKKQSDKVPVPSLNVDYIQEANNAAINFPEFLKKTVITSPGKKEEADLSSKAYSYFLPYERDAEKLKLKGLVSPLEQRKKVSQANSQLQLEDYNSCILSNDQQTERLDVTGSRIYKGTTSKKSKEQNSLESIDEKSSCKNDSAKKNMNLSIPDRQEGLKSNYSSLENSPDAKIPKLSKIPLSSTRKITQKHFKIDMPNGKNEMSPSALHPSTFPLFSSPKVENGTDTSLKKRFNFNECVEITLNVERTLPKLKDKKNTMISSKHNLFRLKPSKDFLEFRHYLTSIQPKDSL